MHTMLMSTSRSGSHAQQHPPRNDVSNDTEEADTPMRPPLNRMPCSIAGATPTSTCARDPPELHALQHIAGATLTSACNRDHPKWLPKKI